MSAGGPETSGTAPANGGFRPLLASLRARLGAARTVPDSLQIVGARFPIEGWRVLVQRRGAAAVELTPAQARALAAELIEMAEILEGKRW